MSIKQTCSLEGRRAIVTGGASGIGNAVARAFHAAGEQVTLHDLRADAAEAAAKAIGI